MTPDTGAQPGAAALATITYAILDLPSAGVRSPAFAAAAVLTLLFSATFAVRSRRASSGKHPQPHGRR